MNLLATIEDIANWFARLTGDAKTEADVRAGASIACFWTARLAPALHTPEGVALIADLQAAFLANVAPPAPKPDPGAEAGARGGSLYQGDGALRNEQR